VMGGEETAIHETTKNVLIESAWFEPLSVRRTAKRQGMHTDASHRFERGADLAAAPVAASRAAELILELAGGEVASAMIDVFPGEQKRLPLIVQASEIERILGQAVPAEEIERILRRLGFRAVADRSGQWMVEPPPFRSDVQREIDVIEEIARHHGYQRFAPRLPAWAGVAHRAPNHAAEQVLRGATRALGYNESMSFTLISEVENSAFTGAEPVRLGNPLSDEGAVLRGTLVPSLLNGVAWNLNRGVRSVRLFEVASIYLTGSDAHDPPGAAYQEPPVLGLAASGAAAEPSVHAPARETTFYDLKGDVENLLDLFQHEKLTFDADTGVEYYHPGGAARALMDGEMVARFGQIHPRVALDRKLRQPVFIAEVFLDRLWRRGLRQVRFTVLSRVPAVDRDLSLLIPEAVPFERVAEVAGGLGIAEMTGIQPVEIFRGGQAPEGKYSLLLRLVFQHPERTLSDAEVNAWSRQVASALREQLGAEQRTG